MSLTPGTRLGPHEVIAQIGVGGMGEVYRATDTKLGREVALKILPGAFAQDAERLARFKREAHVLAALNHPGIAHIYGLEDADGRHALVMELVEGPTLADRIAQGAIPVDEALPIAKQIAEALEAAHEQNIIHRDLKPANIKIRDDGTVKVLDFGLAKAMEPTGSASSPSVSQSPTITTPAMTQMGMILGTAAYMSPEQAKGKPADKRTDIWAFGCVLYEMLTGQRAFEADDISTTLADVIRSEPAWDVLPAGLPSALETYVRRCLEKDLRNRIQAIGDVRLALEGAFESVGKALAPDARVRPAWRLSLVVVLAMAVAAAGTWIAARGSSASDRSSGRTQFAHPLRSGQTFRDVLWRQVTISADGRQFAYNTASGVYLRAMDGLEARLIPGTERPLSAPTLSPDGQELAFERAGEVMRLAVAGGAPVVLGSVAQIAGMSWSADGTIVAADAGGIWGFENGRQVRLAEPADGEQLSLPQMLPGGNRLLMTVSEGTGNRSVVVQSLGSGDRQVLLEGAHDGRYLRSGHLLYQTEQEGLHAVAWDPTREAVEGPGVSVYPALPSGFMTGGGQYAVAENGTLVVASNISPAQPRQLVWVDRAGMRVGDLDVVADGLQHPALSHDDRWVAFSARQGSSYGVFVYSLETRTTTTLSSPLERAERPVWSPSGDQVAFISLKGGGTVDIVIRDADASGDLVPLSLESGVNFISDWHRVNDQDELLLFDRGGTNGFSAYLERHQGDGEWSQPQAFPIGENNVSAILSPNGRYVAYVDNTAARPEVVVRSFPEGDARWQISGNGGSRPRWSPAGTELFYVQPDPTVPRGGGQTVEPAELPEREALMAVPVSTEGRFSSGQPQELFEWPGLAAGHYNNASFDVSGDGTRFLVIEPTGEAPTPSVQVTLNWFDELQRLVPTQ